MIINNLQTFIPKSHIGIYRSFIWESSNVTSGVKGFINDNDLN